MVWCVVTLKNIQASLIFLPSAKFSVTRCA